MAFSQKHDGKVFVPWYNTNEWRSVYNFLTSNCPENLRKALSILKIWKSRTPLLSAGVEGTLILLETILSDFNNTPEAQVIQIYSTTLLRFLNISAANSNKQGNFNRTVSKNDLPKWLIDIRHDIAHDHILPSKSMLELALTHSLQWLIEKYWKIQNHSISDYIVSTDDNSNAKIFDCLNAYVRLNLNMYRGFELNEYDEALMEKINYLVSKRYNKLKTDTQGLIIILEEILKQSLSDPDNRKIANKVVKILVDEKALLATHLEMTEEGNEIIPKTFRKLWLNLLNILYENEAFLTALFDQLWLFLCNSNNEIAKKITSLWICDLLNGLLKMQALLEELNNQIEQNPSQTDLMTTRLNLKYKLEKKFPEYQDCTEFESLEKLCLVNLDNLEKNVLDKPNIFAAKFFDGLMKFNNNPEEYRSLMTRMFTDMYKRIGRTSNIGFSNTSTIDNLSFNLDTCETDVPSRIDKNCSEDTKDVVMKEANGLHHKRWILIKDTLPYKNCPLGKLPHQTQTENPLLMNHG